MKNKYRMSGKISLSKMIEFLPATLLTSFSSLLLQSVDGIVVGLKLLIRQGMAVMEHQYLLNMNFTKLQFLAS